MQSTRICTTPGCDREWIAREMCLMHYKRWRTRTPESDRERPTLEERFNSFFVVKGADECWEWTGKLANGYGHFRLGGHMVTASVHSLEIATGSKANGLFACHTCDNPPCVNPAHLYWGTKKDNSRDSRERNRVPRGSAKTGAILDESSVLVIRERYSRGDSVVDMATEYGVNKGTISHVALGKSWKHVGGPIVYRRKKI